MTPGFDQAQTRTAGPTAAPARRCLLWAAGARTAHRRRLQAHSHIPVSGTGLQDIHKGVVLRRRSRRATLSLAPRLSSAPKKQYAAADAENEARRARLLYLQVRLPSSDRECDAHMFPRNNTQVLTVLLKKVITCYVV